MNYTNHNGNYDEILILDYIQSKIFRQTHKVKLD